VRALLRVEGLNDWNQMINLTSHRCFLASLFYSIHFLQNQCLTLVYKSSPNVEHRQIWGE